MTIFDESIDLDIILIKPIVLLLTFLSEYKGRSVLKALFEVVPFLGEVRYWSKYCCSRSKISGVTLIDGLEGGFLPFFLRFREKEHLQTSSL